MLVFSMVRTKFPGEIFASHNGQDGVTLRSWSLFNHGRDGVAIIPWLGYIETKVCMGVQYRYKNVGTEVRMARNYNNAHKNYNVI